MRARLSTLSLLSALVAAVLVWVGACADLPTADTQRIHLELSLDTLGPARIGDTVTLSVNAVDPEGRRLLAPPVVWTLSPHHDSPPAAIIRQTDGTAWVEGRLRGSMMAEARVDAQNPYFEAAAVVGELPVLYGPMTVSFVDPGPRVLDHRGRFDLRVTVQDDRGWEVPDGEFRLRVLGDSVTHMERQWFGVLEMSAHGIGTDTLVLSHTECYEPCADTLILHVDPVPFRLDFDGVGPLTSLGDTVRLKDHVGVLDSWGYPVPGIPIELALENPADTAIIEMVDPSEGIVVARANGSAPVRASGAGLTDTYWVTVWQVIVSYEIVWPDSVMVVGSVDTLRIDAWDGNGHPVTIDQYENVRTRIYSSNPDVLSVQRLDVYAAQVTAEAPGTASLDVGLFSCDPDCSYRYHSLGVRTDGVP